MAHILNENTSIFWRLALGLIGGVVVFVVVDELSSGLFPAIAFGIGGLAVWLIARR